MDDKNLENENLTPEVEDIPTPIPETEATPEPDSSLNNFVNGDPNAKPPVDNMVMPKVEFTPPPQPEPTNYITIDTTKPNQNGVAIASMVCGIVGAVFGILGICCNLGCCCWPISLLTSIAAVVLAIIDYSKKKTFTGFTVAGLICGIIGIIVPIAYLLFMFIFSYDTIMDIISEGMSGDFNFDYNFDY